MPLRLSHAIIVCFWLAAMSWLVVVKILPGLRTGQRPDYYSTLAADAARRPPDCWRILWHDRTIGFAATDVERMGGGEAVMRSVVQFERLPVQSIANELFGVLSVMLRPFMRDAENLEMEFLIASQLHFDGEHRFSGFTTRIDVAQEPDFLVLTGTSDRQGKIDVAARMFPDGTGTDGTEILTRQIDLPPGALVRDALAPRPELKNLTVGQSWTIPVYRPFPPGSPPQIVQATVKRLEPIHWEGQEVETMVVEYLSAAGSNINIASDPIGLEWIRLDGTVIRQQVMFSGVMFQFDRMPANALDSRSDLLDADLHPRLWVPAHGDPVRARTRDSKATKRSTAKARPAIPWVLPDRLAEAW